MGLKLAFIGLTILTNLFLVFIGYEAINDSSTDPRRDKTKLLVGIIVWQLVILAVSSTGVLTSYAFPPRFVIAFILPSFIFTGIFLWRNRNKKWIGSIPEQWIIYFQSFRVLVEILFVFALSKGIFNYQVTIEGYNFDVIFSFTAPILAFLVYNKKVLSRKTVVIWNYIGLSVLASVIVLFFISVYAPEIFGSQSPLLPLEALTYPYLLIAAFLMPTAVFLHILSLIQISRAPVAKKS